jgi:hypothetical protein
MLPRGCLWQAPSSSCPLPRLCVLLGKHISIPTDWLTVPLPPLPQVPGEMFSLAMSAKRRGMGVVGSTSNILDFIAAKVSGPCINQHWKETCNKGSLIIGFVANGAGPKRCTVSCVALLLHLTGPGGGGRPPPLPPPVCAGH